MKFYLFFAISTACAAASSLRQLNNVGYLAPNGCETLLCFADPCTAANCADDETCVIQPTQQGNACTGCDVAQCSKSGGQCGARTCGNSQVCCNESCGICVDDDPVDPVACTKQACEEHPRFKNPPSGDVVCPAVKCIAPCPAECPTKEDGCITRDTFLVSGCPGCEQFVRCAREKETCGENRCGPGQYCCNPSCGICADAFGGFCTLQICDDNEPI